MKRILNCFVLSFLLLFVASQLSYAGPEGPINKMETGLQHEGPFSRTSPMMPCDMEQMKGMPELRNLQGIHFQIPNLDEKQKEAFREIENSVMKALIRKRADEQIAAIDLRELLGKDNIDLKTVEIKLKEIAAIETESQLMVIKAMERIKAKLTPEQRELLKKIRPMDHPRMRPPMRGEMMQHEAEIPPPSAKERGE